MGSILRSIAPDFPNHFARDRNCQAIFLGCCLVGEGGAWMADIRVFLLELSAQQSLIDLESVLGPIEKERGVPS